MNSNRETELKAQLRSIRNLQAIAMANKDGRGLRRLGRELDRTYSELQKVRKGQ
jgi:hypothetical protein